MTHNWKRTDWTKEGAIGLSVGVLYGLTNVCVGHPFDTVKTKMQAQPGFESTGMVKTFTKTLRTQGFVGLYRGCVPPLMGSGIYRSIQFAAFEAVYTKLDTRGGKLEIPYSGGVQLRIFAGAFASATCRALIETPLEYAKVRRQTQQMWLLKDIYTGFGITWCRTVSLMTTYFIIIDSGRRHLPDQFARPVFGPFFMAGAAATLAWWIVWPLEYMKNQVQCSFGSEKSIRERMVLVMQRRGGFFGLYRGILPGSLRSFIANGCAMVVMQFAQRKATEWGFRN